MPLQVCTELSCAHYVLLHGGRSVVQSQTLPAGCHSLQGPSAIQAAPAPHEEALHPDAGIAGQLDLAEPKQ